MLIPSFRKLKFTAPIESKGKCEGSGEREKATEELFAKSPNCHREMAIEP